MDGLIFALLAILLAATVIVVGRLGDNAEIRRVERQLGMITPETEANMLLRRATERYREDPEFPQRRQALVAAMTHGRTNDWRYLSASGTTYLANAIRNERTPESIAAEMPSPTPEDYLNIPLLTAREKFPPRVAPQENGAVMQHFAGTPERVSGRDYVLALTHGRHTSLNDLSREGVRYVSNAVRKGKTPAEIAAEIPNPTPQFYLAR